MFVQEVTATDPISRLLEAAEHATRPWPDAGFIAAAAGATADDAAFITRSTPEVVAALARVFVAAKNLRVKQTEDYPVGLTELKNAYRRRQEELGAALTAAEKALGGEK